MPLRFRIRTCFSETFRTLFSPLTLFIWGALIVLATISGPFETHQIAPWPMRGMYWLIVVSLSVLIGYSARAVSLAMIGTGKPALLDAVTIAQVTVILSPIIWMINMVALPSYVDNPPLLTRLAGYVMLCAMVVVFGRRVAPGFEKQGYGFPPETDTAAEPRAEPDAKPRLLRRLSPDVQGRIIRLTANDHFVEIATEFGAESLRMRLTDAIDEMEPVEGYCVHRSHWVAHEAITGVERENAHKLYVILSNNDRIPVSRKYRVNVETAGWI